MARRVVLFGLGGVLLTPGLQHFLGSCEREFSLPRNFLRDVMFSGDSESLYSRAVKGRITLTQLLAETDEGCRKAADSLGIALPGDFSVGRAFQELAEQGTLNIPILRAAAILRRNGFQTCILTNNWVDDGAGRLRTAQLMDLLRRRFQPLLESCRIGMRKPEHGIYSHALGVLRVKPEEVIFLDDVGENLEVAREMGMATILARDDGGSWENVLEELERLSGVQLRLQQEPLPPACDPSQLSHGYVPIRPGVRLHFVEMGHGPPVLLCHGFPESWLSWRFQIPALADAGFRAMALEMKGYGESTAPPDIPEYSQEQICKDLVVFLDKLGIPQVTLVGHDWGGAVAWNMALFYPERIRAVASLNTPYRPADPGADVMEKLEANPVWEYQLYFQEPGVAEAELEKDVGRTLKGLIRSTRPEDRLEPGVNFRGIRERGGLLVGLPENPLPSQILPGPELEFYIQSFRKSGFRGPLNWYRNIRSNWSWALTARDRKIPLPALMVTAGRDPVLHPVLSQGMENWIPRLRREHIEECGHWTQMERPAELNRILLGWLEGLPPDAAFPRNSRL
ncbi:HYES hydrolase, partial [Pitta sordida]|nr:HYES hydrolase [Pitta sordida]